MPFSIADGEPIAQLPRWNTDPYLEGWDVPSDDCTGPHDGAFAHRDAGRDDRSVTNPNIATNRCRCLGRSSCELDRRSDGIPDVITTHKSHIWCQHRVSPDCSRRWHQTAWADVHVFSCYQVVAHRRRSMDVRCRVGVAKPLENQGASATRISQDRVKPTLPIQDVPRIPAQAWWRDAVDEMNLTTLFEVSVTS